MAKPIPNDIPADVKARFWAKVAVGSHDECWPWTGATSNGYASFSIGNVGYPAHRLSRTWSVGPFARHLVIDHLCRNPSCVNPAHLEPVTNQENVRRGIAGELNKLRGAAVAACPHGHAYTPENTRYNPRGSRCCRACDRIRGLRYNRRRTDKSHRPARAQDGGAS